MSVSMSRSWSRQDLQQQQTLCPLLVPQSGCCLWSTGQWLHLRKGVCLSWQASLFPFSGPLPSPQSSPLYCFPALAPSRSSLWLSEAQLCVVRDHILLTLLQELWYISSPIDFLSPVIFYHPLPLLHHHFFIFSPQNHFHLFPYKQTNRFSISQGSGGEEEWE